MVTVHYSSPLYSVSLLDFFNIVGLTAFAGFLCLLHFHTRHSYITVSYDIFEADQPLYNALACNKALNAAIYNLKPKTQGRMPNLFHRQLYRDKRRISIKTIHSCILNDLFNTISLQSLGPQARLQK